MREKIRIVVAGQKPPPFHGQNITISEILDILSNESDIEVRHLPFRFNLNLKRLRKVTVSKIGELFKVVFRLLAIRLEGRIDCLLYPIGGPHQVPVMRDVLLLPWCILIAKRVVLNFQTGGIANALPRFYFPLRWIALFVYRYSTHAMVWTEFGKQDPQSLGIKNVSAIPHWLPDNYEPAMLNRGKSDIIKILCVGLVTPDKGTPALLRAFSRLIESYPDCRLVIVGECLPPYTEEQLHDDIKSLNIEKTVELTGFLTGDMKWHQFAEADLYVFPSVAPQETFGRSMVEAMMWALPIVATDWRTNAEVLGDNPGGLCFPTEPDLIINLTQALENALQKKDLWEIWGNKNRTQFLNSYEKNRIAPVFTRFLKNL